MFPAEQFLARARQAVAIWNQNHPDQFVPTEWAEEYLRTEALVVGLQHATDLYLRTQEFHGAQLRCAEFEKLLDRTAPHFLRWLVTLLGALP
jgi:hypothetical protein